MAAVSHGVRQLRQGILHIPTRSLFSRLLAHLSPPRHSTPIQPSLARPTKFSNPQSINARFSLPVKHALARPFAPPRLPKPPTIPQNVTHVGLGTARAFHSGRPIFQNMVDNVPIATRALWEAEWDVKMKKKEARKMRRPTMNKRVLKSEQMLKPNPIPLIAEKSQSELDIYFPPEHTPAVTTHLLVPLAPTPTARLPLSTPSDGGGAHPLLPISDLAHIHSSHRLHSLRVSTLFARLDSANVWDDPGVNVDAYAFGPRYDANEKQCTILRVTFRGWNTSRVRAILGDSTEWYSLQETRLDGHPTPALPDVQQDAYGTLHPGSPPTESAELDSYQASEVALDDESDVLSQLPTRISASAQHDLVLPTLDFSSSASSVAANNPSQPPQPVIFLRTVSEMVRDAEPASSVPFSMAPSTVDESWESLGLSSSFLKHVEESRRGEVVNDM